MILGRVGRFGDVVVQLVSKLTTAHPIHVSRTQVACHRQLDRPI